MQSHVVEEITDEQVLHLLNEGYGAFAKTQGIHARGYLLIVISLVRCNTEDVEQ